MQLTLESSIPIREIKKSANDIDLFINCKDRPVNISFEKEKDAPNQFQFTKCHQILIRYSKDSASKILTLHLLASIDLNYGLSFELDYSDKRIVVEEKEFFISLAIKQK